MLSPCVQRQVRPLAAELPAEGLSPAPGTPPGARWRAEERNKGSGTGRNWARGWAVVLCVAVAGCE